METPPPPPALDRASSSASSADATAQATFTKDEVLAMLAADKFKKFTKKKCGECGVACMKRFASSSPMIVKPMLNTFWCKECGRLLCENHRQQHTCERVDAEKARKQAMTHEQVAEEVARAEMQKEIADAEAAALKRQQSEEASARYFEMKARRKILAGKSTHVANFVQNLSLQADGPNQQELLELYTAASRINLRLWNEHETPSQSGLAEDEWQRLCTIYDRACEVSGMQLTLDGQPFELHNSWETAEEDARSS